MAEKYASAVVQHTYPCERTGDPVNLETDACVCAERIRALHLGATLFGPEEMELLRTGKATVTHLDGSPAERGPDGLIAGAPVADDPLAPRLEQP